MATSGEVLTQRFRRTVAGAVVAAAIMVIVALPLSVITVLQAPLEPLSPGAIAWIISLCALLHGAGFLCSWRPAGAFIAGSVLMLLLAFTVVPDIGSAGFLPSGVVYLLLLWRIASGENRQRSRAALATGLVGAVLIPGVNAARPEPREPMSVIFEAGSLIAAILAAWALGALSRQYRLAEDHRAQESVHQAIGEERGRISRDLHDVVSHSLTVMIAQAEAARVIAGSRPSGSDPETDASLERVAETGREAMRGLRSMIHTLDDPDSGPLTPVSGVHAVTDLVDHARSAEHAIDLTVRGTPQRLPPDADLAAFRVIQEAVTNAIRHLRSPLRIDVSLDWHDSEVVITVHDDGGRGPLHYADPAGTGLIGLTERVRRAGGTLNIRRHPSWCVRATLPVEVAS